MVSTASYRVLCSFSTPTALLDWPEKKKKKSHNLNYIIEEKSHLELTIYFFLFKVWAAAQVYLGTKNLILSWKLETDSREVDEILGVNVIIAKRGRSPRKKSRETLTFRGDKDDSGIAWMQRL